MDLKVVFVVVCLISLDITSTEAGIPKCCIKTRDIQAKMLNKFKCWERQSSAGACDIDALILYIKGQRIPFCAHPKWEKRLKKLLGSRKTLKQYNLGKC